MEKSDTLISGEDSGIPRRTPVAQTPLSPQYRMQPLFMRALKLAPLSVMIYAGSARAATFTVTNTSDSGAGSLRAAIISTNGTLAADTVNFKITGGGPATINLLSPLPAMNGSVVLNGTLQAGFTNEPIVEIKGSAAGAGADGLVFNAANCSVKSLILNGFSGSAIKISGAAASDNKVLGCYIGTNAPGLVAAPNGVGVRIEAGAHDNLVGGVGFFEPNLISGNSQAGVLITDAGSSTNSVLSNYIGTAAGGGTALPNGVGVKIALGAVNNQIGGVTAGYRNLISGNTLCGVLLTDPGTNSNDVAGNFIGTTTDGMSAIGNGVGVQVRVGASQNIIGGTTAARSNLISGNVGAGVDIGDARTRDILVQGNFIGTVLDGTAALPNGHEGVLLQGGTSFNTIGGDVAGAGNTISGNGQSGVVVAGSGSYSNTIQGNRIGTNSVGTGAVPNNAQGVFIIGGASSTNLGGTTPGSKNVISGNKLDGVVIFSVGSNNNRVYGNFIGVDAGGTYALPNGSNGVTLDSGPQYTVIGSTLAGARNVISGNLSNGVNIRGASTKFNNVRGNIIGLNASGTGALGNLQNGVYVQFGAQGNGIGGTTAGAPNTLSGNGQSGVRITDTNTTGNHIEGNFIGVNANGSAYPNGNCGVQIISGAQNNFVGGTVAGSGNIISGNKSDGVRITGANLNTVWQNRIGTNIAGTSAVPNTRHGVEIDGAAQSNAIGGIGSSTRNIISGNGSDGVRIFFDDADNNFVQGNYIGLDAAGTSKIPNLNFGVEVSTHPQFTTIGGTSAGARNLIAGNALSGIRLYNCLDNVVQGNTIGMDGANGNLGNGNYGIEIGGGSQFNTIGGTVAGARNSICENGLDGVRINGTATNHNDVQGNYIGLDVTGQIILGNLYGVSITSGAQFNTVGGTAAGARNVISGNRDAGVYISGINTKLNTVQGNYIGLAPAGTSALGNFGVGVQINSSASNNTIGGTSVAARNVISGNAYGVGIGGVGTNANLVQGNFIGLNAAGTAAVPNTSEGIYVVYSASNNVIGGVAAGAGKAPGNVISGNGGDGITIENTGPSATDGTLIQCNFIGTNAAGTGAVANGGNGIFTHGTHTMVGGGAPSGAGNRIAFNTLDGVRVGSSASSATAAIRFNSIFSNGRLGINLVGGGIGTTENAAGVTTNDVGDGDSGPNGLQNYPVLIPFQANTTSIIGVISSHANQDYELDFFSSPTADPSGFGEGKTWIGSTIVHSNASGDAVFSFQSANSLSGQFVTATATDSLNRTSEFSAAVKMGSVGGLLGSDEDEPSQ